MEESINQQPVEQAKQTTPQFQLFFSELNFKYITVGLITILVIGVGVFWFKKYSMMYEPMRVYPRESGPYPSELDMSKESASVKEKVSQKPTSKMHYHIQQKITELDSLSGNNIDYSQYSTPLLHISGKGHLKLGIHSDSLIDDSKEAYLESLGVRKIANSRDTVYPPGIDPIDGYNYYSGWFPFKIVKVVEVEPWIVQIEGIGDVYTDSL